MLCRPDASDRLIRHLFDKYDLSVLSVAMTSDELHPGKIIRTFPTGQKRAPCVDSADKLFTPPPQLEIAKTAFVPIAITDSSDKVSAEVLASLAGALGQTKLDRSEVLTALKKSRGTNFQISLSGSGRSDISEVDLERALGQTTLTKFGEQCQKNGERFFVVTRTVLATKARISADAELSAAAEALVKLPPFLEGKIAARVIDGSKATLEMERLDREMVIGIRAIEIVESGAGMFLKGLDKPLRLRDGQPRPHAEANAFNDDGTAFARLDYPGD